jgi:hypothetical protein
MFGTMSIAMTPKIILKHQFGSGLPPIRNGGPVPGDHEETLFITAGLIESNRLDVLTDQTAWVRIGEEL